MKNRYIIFFITVIFISISHISCKKYLDAKPNEKLIVPTTVKSLQGILDWYYYMNVRCSEAGAIASDNYYLSDAKYLALRADRARDAYLWKPGIFAGMSPTDWNNEYNVVYNANVVLDNLKKIKRTAMNKSAWDNCKGSALFFRGKSFYEIAQIWAKAFDSATADIDLGIPLRLTSNFNVKSVRSSILETYHQIISDLKASIPLLPDHPLHPYRPSKAAAYGYLGRTYLCMRNYIKAEKYADSCLSINDHLIDYNTLDVNAKYPFAEIQFTNPEDIMHTNCVLTNLNLAYIFGAVDTLLYQSYEMDDLRRVIFFQSNADGSHYFKGSYDGTLYNYNGIATDEMYLIRAECNARIGNVNAAMEDLNTLLRTRWETGKFIPFTASSMEEAVKIILEERRKELVNRMLRFSDIKRLNKEGANITIARVIEGKKYILPPNDPYYALPIPENVIQRTGMQQN